MAINSSISSSSIVVRRTALLMGFVLLIFVGDRGLSLLLDRMVQTSHLRFSLLYSGKIQADVVVLGDSRAAASFFAPRLSQLSGARVFNLGYNGLGPVLASRLFADFLERNSPPRALILDITSVFSNEDLIRDMRLYALHSKRLNHFLQMSDPRLYFWSTVSWLFRYNNEMFLRALYYARKSDQSWANHYKISAAQIRALKSLPHRRIELVPRRLRALVDICRQADRHGIRVLLVAAPYAPGYTKTLDGFYQTIKRVKETLGRNRDFADFSQLFHNYELFGDYLHLNISGAIALAPVVVHKLKLGRFRTVQGSSQPTQP